jgi:hypothetical protein
MLDFMLYMHNIMENRIDYGRCILVYFHVVVVHDVAK